MALITTPGAADADSAGTLAEADAWHLSMGNSTWTGTDEVKEQAMRRAIVWLDGQFGSRFVGVPASATQARQWPRSNAYYRGVLLAEDAIPEAYKRAQFEAALIELESPGGLTASASTEGQQVIREKIGEIEIQYAEGVVQTSSAKAIVEIQLGGLIKSATPSMFGGSVRM